VLVQGMAADYDGLANFDAAKPLQKVRKLGPECFKVGTELNRQMRKAMGAKWDVFTAALQLRDAHQKGQSYEIATALHRLKAAQIPEPEEPEKQKIRQSLFDGMAEFWSGPKWSKETAPVNLPPSFTQELRNSRLVLWYDRRGKRVLPAFFCEDFTSAVFVLGLLDYVRACVGCGKVFIPEREDQIYHDIACRERNRMRRLRWKRNKKALKAL
jgi:hypothetical protein